MNERPLLLLTNDDGYRAGGIQALRAELSAWADVVLVAPETEQSATSHSLSIHRPLRFRQASEGQFSLDGTPADCVYVALHAIGRVLPRRPDMVVSGLNHGVNLGADVFYSGTVGGAREGALRRIPALAASADSHTDRTTAARYASKVARELLALLQRQDISRPTLFNLNIPAGPGPWPLRRTTLGSRLYVEEVTFAKGPRGLEFLWIGGAPKPHDPIPGSDTEAFDAGYASLTPLVLDLSSATEVPLADDLVAAITAQETP